MWDQIQGVRNTELGVLWKSFLVAAVNSFLLNFLPTFVSVATFFGYVALGHNLTAAEAFTSLALFNVRLSTLSLGLGCRVRGKHQPKTPRSPKSR